MTTTIVHISMPRYPNLFLVAQKKAGFLVTCDPADGSFGHICPCCFFKEERQQIMEAVTKSLLEGVIEGKVRWCCHQMDSDHGDRLGAYAPLIQENFRAGSANVDILPEVKVLIHAEAVRVANSGLPTQ